ncbi:MAG: hypothetical protein M3Y85_04410 [Bacteroidota bacterium]|nr:hypothetical protein [Bacteroidota bacterium]
MLKKYSATKPVFVDTYEAYSKTVFVGNNNVVVPYISVGLMPHNPIINKQSVVDYSYYVFTSVRSMNFTARKGKLTVDFNVIADKEYIAEYIMAGGYKSDNCAEVKIDCEGLIFYIAESAKIGQFGDFMPIDTSNFKQNMDTDTVESFFLIDNLPQEIKEVLGSNIYCLTWW